MMKSAPLFHRSISKFVTCNNITTKRSIFLSWSRSYSSFLFERSNIHRPQLLPSPLQQQQQQHQQPSSLLQRKQSRVVFFSSDNDSHSDFAPKKKTVGGEDEALKMIDDHVKSNRIMLYMKGNPKQPMCGFSARVVSILKEEGVDFSSVNVLDYPSIRESVKKYSQWPTIPQLYVDSQFIGGCDIIVSMHESGELRDLLKADKEEGDKK